MLCLFPVADGVHQTFRHLDSSSSLVLPEKFLGNDLLCWLYGGGGVRRVVRCGKSKECTCEVSRRAAPRVPRRNGSTDCIAADIFYPEIIRLDIGECVGFLHIFSYILSVKFVVSTACT